MVREVRRGRSMRAVARDFRVSLSTLQWWVERARGRRLDRVDWEDRAPVPHRVHRTAAAVEDTILAVREELRTHSDLGELGAQAIRRELLARGAAVVPAVRTIGRILARRGVLERGRALALRRPFPTTWTPDLQQPPHGQLIFVRRASEQGTVYLLGHWLLVTPAWAHRLVRAEVPVPAGEIQFYGLRRRQPHDQPLLASVPYALPPRPFRG